MTGGTGSDTYTVDNALDSVTENAGEGTDLVRSRIDYTLGANLENLTFLGSSDLNGTGNDLANALRGNAGDNVLDGGAGADKLYGYGGNDTCIIDNAGDGIAEAAGGGTDTALASVSYSLAANVENLTLTGAANIDGTGNGLDNVITGNAGDNVITGGLGADTLTGGDGRDVFVYNSVNDSLPTGFDSITDFLSSAGEATVDDQLDLSRIDADSSTAGDDAFTWGGIVPTAHGVWTSPFTINADSSADWIVYADVNGDTTPEFEIHMHSAVANFSTDDIVF
jgi:Ca2+-binding RTX toxin-like protein